MARDPFAAAERHIQRESRALRKDRLGDFRRARGMGDAIFSNILGDVGTARRRLSAGNARDLAAIQRLMARQRAGQGGVRAGMLGAGGHTAAADYAGQAFAEAGATAAGGTTAAAGQAAAGQQQAAGSQAALDMIRGSVRSTAEAARYATAQALTTRAQQDVTTIGAEQHDLDMARIQYAQAQAMERQQEAFQMQMAQYQAAQARKQAAQSFHYSMRLQQANTTSAAAGQYGSDINSLANASASALRVMQNLGNLDDAYDAYVKAQNQIARATGKVSPVADKTTWLAQQAAASLGIGQQDPAMMVIARLAGTFIAHGGLGGPNTRAMNADIIAHLLQAYPQFRGKPEKVLRKTVFAALVATADMLKSDAAQAIAGGGAAGPGGVGPTNINPEVRSAAAMGNEYVSSPQEQQVASQSGYIPGGGGTGDLQEYLDYQRRALNLGSYSR